jgi:hypothetical protein
MANVTKIRQDTKPTLSPERERLAELIAANTAADDRRAALAAATAAASDAVSSARAELHAATAGLDRARADMVEHSIAGAGSGAPMTIRAARDRVTDAEDALVVAVGVSDSLAAQLADVGNPEWAKDRLRDGAFAVIATEAKPQAIVAATELRQQLAGRLAELEWLHLNGLLRRNTFGVPSDSSVSAGLVLLQSAAWADQAAAMAAGRDRWDAALAALMRDPSAPLPE